MLRCCAPFWRRIESPEWVPRSSTYVLGQSADARLLPYLQQLGHDATRIGSDYPSGLPDRQVLDIARKEGRILITDDRDFGELVVRQRLTHAGVIFLRLGDDADLATKINRLAHVLTHYAGRLDRFLVVTKSRVRIRNKIEGKVRP